MQPQLADTRSVHRLLYHCLSAPVEEDGESVKSLKLEVGFDIDSHSIRHSPATPAELAVSSEVRDKNSWRVSLPPTCWFENLCEFDVMMPDQFVVFCSS